MNPQRMHVFTYDHAVELCATIGDFVHREVGATGIQALTLQRDLLHGLGLALVNLRALVATGAVEYVQQRKLSVISTLNEIHDVQPDLLEPGPDPDMDPGLELAKGFLRERFIHSPAPQARSEGGPACVSGAHPIGASSPMKGVRS